MIHNRAGNLDAAALRNPTGIDRRKIHLERSPYPLASSSSIAGFSANAATQSSLSINEKRQMAKLIDVVLKDPILQGKVCDRVYELMLAEAQKVREMSSPFR